MAVQALAPPKVGTPTLQRPGNGVFSSSPTVPRPQISPSMRPRLPNRNVTAGTIEDAYVDFILHCNPAVPPDVDNGALREAFRTPPKSGGKSFSTFTLYELIKQLEAKELKTWAELALKLGVEPPDQDKGQSSQKIQQYAVRLKRWMHSMHVDTFFKYLMNSPHPYWTDIPQDFDAFTEQGRDGVAAEDDMALRALLPHIRPRRGRRRPEDDDLNKSPSQRPRLDDSSAVPDDLQRPEAYQAWSAHPDGRPVFTFDTPDTSMLQPRSGQGAAPTWGNADVNATPLTAFPRSAITPSTRADFWAEEPRSAVTPMRSRAFNKRHGAKVVSSAWKVGGTGKIRGRPPINRQANDGSFSAFPTSSDTQTFKLPGSSPSSMLLSPDLHSATGHAAGGVSTLDIPRADMSLPVPDHQPANSRPSKPSRLSLQVPERVGGEVRLATPPPVVMINGQQAPATAPNGTAGVNHGTPDSPDSPEHPTGGTENTAPPLPMTAMAAGVVNTPPQDGAITFQDPSDTTNLDEVQAYFVHEIVRADWYDGDGGGEDAIRSACPVDEAYAIANTVLETIRAKAESPESFLVNIAVLCGGKILMTTTKLKCTRLHVLADRTHYRCEWELRLRDVRASYKMEETVLHSLWKKKEKNSDPSGSAEHAEGQTAEMWQQKYRNLLDVLAKREKTLADITYAGLESLREHGRKKPPG